VRGVFEEGKKRELPRTLHLYKKIAVRSRPFQIKEGIGWSGRTWENGKKKNATWEDQGERLFERKKVGRQLQRIEGYSNMLHQK